MPFFSKGKRPTRVMELPISDSLPVIPEIQADEKSSAIRSGEDNGGKPSTPSSSSLNNKSSEENRQIEMEEKLNSIIQTIYSGKRIEDTLFLITDEFKELFDCEIVTLYFLDQSKKQLYTRNYWAEGTDEVYLSISKKSLAGYSAKTGKILNIKDVYSATELEKKYPGLNPDHSLDKQFNFKAKSALVLGLYHQKKLMGILEILNKKKKKGFSQSDVYSAQQLAGTLGFAIVKMALEGLLEKILTASLEPNSKELIHPILEEFKEPILQLFDASQFVLYLSEPEKNNLVMKMSSKGVVDETVIPISHDSIPGEAAMEKRMVNITNVNDPLELKRFHSDLKFDSSIDGKSEIKTKSTLACPMIHENHLMGVLQLINKTTENFFNGQDEQNVQALAESLAKSFLNQRNTTKQYATPFGNLLRRGIVSKEDLIKAESMALQKRVDVENILLEEMKISREEIGLSLEAFYNVSYFGFNKTITLPKKILSGLSKNFLKRNNWIPIQQKNNRLGILINNPTDPDKIQNIQLLFPKKIIEFKVGLKADIHDFLNSVSTEEEELLPVKTEEVSSLLDTLRSEGNDEISFQDSRDEDEISAISDSDSTIVRLVNKVITDAYDQGISDIHIEPGVGRKNLKVRFRRDGACRLYEEIPRSYKYAFVSRLKIMSRLDISEKRLPQDGKIKMKYGNVDIELRVATCPTVGGNEDVVLRILSQSKPLPLEKMNFSDRNLNLIKSQSIKPYGLILAVGPTGSGKTTTLHATLARINTPEKKIWTAEDPVEITQEGLRQVQVHKKIGFDFAHAMRSFLRCDPDVIMVGEMRDAETATIGLEASLTGHLVFSTLHTNSAPETVTRLIDMGMNPLNFADALLLIIAQRLVRTLCKKCKKDYNPSREEFDMLVSEYGEERFEELGIEYSKELILKRPVGCTECDDTGYLGRIAIHEILEATDEIKRLIVKKSVMEDIRIQAIKDGMTTLKQDGIAKVFEGHCDLKQVLAVSMV